MKSLRLQRNKNIERRDAAIEKENEHDIEAEREYHHAELKKKMVKLPAEQIDFLKVEKRHMMRAKRSMRTGKEHLQQNLMSKRGMQMFRYEGRLHKFAEREGRGRSNLENWQAYCSSSIAKQQIYESGKTRHCQKDQ